MVDRTKVVLIGIGGTIAFQANGPLDLLEYFETGQMVGIHELARRVQLLDSSIEIIPIECELLPSDAVTPAHWLKLNRLIHEVSHKHQEAKGFVVCHGTSTIEETAYFLHLVSKIDKPVVLVGSQRPWNSTGSDAPLNLLNALRVAVDASSQGVGALLVHGNEIWSARDVSKISGTSILPFHSGDFGILGYADVDGCIRLSRRPCFKHAPDTIFDVLELSELPKVDIAYSYAGANGDAVDAFVKAGCSGIVMVGMLPGTATPAQEKALDRAILAGIQVVMCGRSGHGRVLSRARLRERGIVVASDLSPVKARVLAMLALTITADTEQISQIFQEH